jgi:hypothetical protein
MLKLVNNSCYFEIIINALHEALNELNIEHEIVTNYKNNDNKNVYLICTTHENRTLPKRYISYNFEQLITNKVWQPIFFENLSKAEIVFDYSLENIKILKEHNINAYFLPLGYSKSMEYIKTIEDKSIDFTFLGAINNIRYNKLQSLIDIYYKSKDKIVISNNYWGEDLQNLYRKTKIGLNIHYYSGKTILEVHRIIPLIANKILVISEKSDDEWYNNKYEKIINFFENENYSIDCLKTLKHCKIEEIVDERYQELITKHKYIDYVKEIIHLLNK